MTESRAWDWHGGSVVLSPDGGLRLFVSDLTSVIPPIEAREIALAVLGEAASSYSPAYELGYHVAWREIQDGVASFAEPKERGIYPGDQDSRVEWERGYRACVCAYRVGHGVGEMIEAGILEPTYLTSGAAIESLLDGTWPRAFRPDPRKLTEPPGSR